MQNLNKISPKQIEKELCRRSAHYFIFDSGHLLTKDEHDWENPAKPLPDKPYLRCLLDLLLLTGHMKRPEECEYLEKYGYLEDEEMIRDFYNFQMLLGDKSRQIMATWLVSAYILWRAKFFGHQTIYIQSKKEDDAAAVVSMGKNALDLARITFMETHLPRWLQTMVEPTWTLVKLDGGSMIQGIPEGGNIIRSRVPSVMFSDEAAFQPEFEDAYTAAMPCMQGGGQFIAVSSPELGAFADLLQIQEAPVSEVLGKIPEFSLRRTPSGQPVVRIGFGADEDKRPGTEEGDEWLRSVTARYPGGLNDPRFRKEYRFDYGAMGGTKLFPLWEDWKRYIVVPFFKPIGYKLYASYDHGWRNPASYHIYGVDGDGTIVAFWEFYAAHVGIPHIARILLGDTVILPDGRKFDGNPFAGEEVYRLADPQLWADDQQMSDGTTKSCAELFRRYGVYFQKGERGGDTMVAEWLHGHFWKDLDHPGLKITEACPKLIWEIGQQRHKQLSSKTAINRDQPEELVDKDNHAWDDMKFLLKKFPPRFREGRESRKAGSFHWWRNMAANPEKGRGNRTFRIGQ